MLSHRARASPLVAARVCSKTNSILIHRFVNKSGLLKEHGLTQSTSVQRELLPQLHLRQQLQLQLLLQLQPIQQEAALYPLLYYGCQVKRICLKVRQRHSLPPAITLLPCAL